MKRTQYLFLQDTSTELLNKLEKDGPIQCNTTPPIYLRATPDFNERQGNSILTPENIRGIKTLLKSALTLEYDDATFPTESVIHPLHNVAIASQLVKPTRGFLEYEINTDEHRGILTASTMMRFVPNWLVSPYLTYQQHNTITVDDIGRAIKIVPAIAQSLEQGHGSWVHPFGSIHRAVILFAQGYSVGLEELRQVLWAAGLDSLFASKLDSKLWGAKAISERLQKLFGSDFNPYDDTTVKAQLWHTRPAYRLDGIGKLVFWLRNDYVHGKPISDAAWLTSGYAYHLVECTEILLRATLLKIMEDPALLAIFKDPTKLDAYF